MGLRIRHLVFLGPDREPASVTFGPGLNLIYGASDTGKSFIVEAIDFMLGGRPPLRDIPERVGYDRILLGLETLNGETFTIVRSADGGRFLAYTGLHLALPGNDIQGTELADSHSDRASDNLSAFLLEKCGLSGKRVRKNKRGETISLSFRHIARLLIVTETEITSQRSPLSDGNPTVDTPNFATFKLLLTGVDDSALVSGKPATAEEQTREAQADLLDGLIEDYRARLKQIARQPGELEEQLGKLESALQERMQQLGTTEADFKRAAARRRELRDKVEAAKDRFAEISALLERFDLLARHYDSDVDRLQGIQEAGTLFVALGQSSCPLCGAAPEHHNRETACEGDIQAVVAAARSEIAKIELLRSELTETSASLQREAASIERGLPRTEQQLRTLAQEIEQTISPRLTQMRSTYADLADKRGEVREALAILRTLEDIERRRAELDRASDESGSSAVSDGDLPATVAKGFSEQVEQLLKQWHFPEVDRVHFDQKARDLVIGGKLRTARGKGLRAITHAAFLTGLMQYCRAHNTRHPGFVILDSPLLAYRAPEGVEDDLTGTDLIEQFYSSLLGFGTDSQVIIFENTDPPEDVVNRPQTTMFSKNPHSGRYGFFPLSPEKTETSPPA